MRIWAVLEKESILPKIVGILIIIIMHPRKENRCFTVLYLLGIPKFITELKHTTPAIG